ncbi:MAG: LamG domain-containing protein [Planctomycetaceae bacterium]|nr:LamG domain-containing protein [Planctomycetaceae bacterium]
MSAISAGDLLLLRDRQDTQKTIEKLYVWGFPPMWTGRVNDGSIARGDQTIAYDGGAVQGDFAYADLTEGLMVWFGSSAGADDLGRRILLSITGTAASGSMVVDWYDDMELSDDDYITIVHFRPPWPKLSWFSTADGFYKSGPPASEDGAGIVYSDQNTDPPPHVVMGRCGVVEEAWWLTSTVSSSDCVAAWQAIGALTQAESYINLNQPGTYDLSTATAPTWAAATGWAFNGTTQYLSTALTLGSDYTVIVRTLPSALDKAMVLGSNKTNAYFNVYLFEELPGLGFHYWRWYWGNTYAQWPATIIRPADVAEHTFALSENNAYVDGSFWATVAGTFSVAAPSTFPIGCAHDGAALNDFYPGAVRACAVYNRALTATEIRELTTSIDALDDTTEPPLMLRLDATSSQAVATGASLSTYAWTFTPSSADATIINGSTSQARMYAAPGGKYYSKLTLTDDNTNSSVGYRPLIFDNPNDSFAITEFTRTAIAERYNSFSVSCQITTTSPDVGNAEAALPQVDWSDIQSGVMVILTATDWYGSEQKTITFRGDSRYTDRENILYCGYVIGETRNYGSNSASIQLACVNAVDFFLYSLSLTGVRASTAWYEMDSDLMYVAALLFHLFKWHSTLLEITDWILPWSDGTLRSAVEEWTEGNIMDRARSFAGEHGRLMAITATSQGEFFVEQDANLISEADRNALTTTLTLDNDDVEQRQQVKVNHRPQVSQIYLSGGISDGVMGTFEPYLSVSQNVRKAQGVGAQNFERLMLPDQTETNRLCGRILAVLNRELVEIDMTFAGIYREVFSPTESQWANTGTEIFAAGEITNLRGSTDLNSIRLIPRQVVKRPPSGGFAGVDVVFDIEAPAGELTGRTITLLPVDPFYIPADADTEPPLLGEPLDTLVTGDDTNGVEIYIYSEATWESRNTGLSGDDLKVRDLKIVPYWWIYQNSSDNENAMMWIATDGGIWFTNDCGKSWQDRTPLAALDSAPAGVTPLTVSYYSIDVYSVPTDINRTITAMCREEVTGTVHSWLLISTNSGFNWTSSKRS